PVIDAAGATLVTVRVKVVVAVRPPAPVAVMVTVVGPLGPSGGVYDQLQVPAALSWVIVPSEAVRVTVALPWEPAKVPLFVAGLPSLTVTATRVLVVGVGEPSSSMPPPPRPPAIPGRVVLGS